MNHLPELISTTSQLCADIVETSDLYTKLMTTLIHFHTEMECLTKLMPQFIEIYINYDMDRSMLTAIKKLVSEIKNYRNPAETMLKDLTERLVEARNCMKAIGYTQNITKNVIGKIVDDDDDDDDDDEDDDEDDEDEEKEHTKKRADGSSYKKRSKVDRA